MLGDKITVGLTPHRRTTMGRFNNQSLSNTQGLRFTPTRSVIMKKEIGTRAKEPMLIKDLAT
jgi:hypothetical protein